MLKKKYLLPATLWILVLTIGGVTAGNIVVNVNKSGHITFGQGVAVAATCQVQPLMITPVAQYQVQGSQDFLLSEIRVANIDSSCMNKYLVFRFHGIDGNPLPINQDFAGDCKPAAPSAQPYDCIGNQDSLTVYLDNSGTWQENFLHTFHPGSLGSPFVTGSNSSYFIRNLGRGSGDSSVTYSTPVCSDSTTNGTPTLESYEANNCSISSFTLLATQLYNSDHIWCSSYGFPYSYVGDLPAARSGCNAVSDLTHFAYGSRSINYISVETQSH